MCQYQLDVKRYEKDDSIKLLFLGAIHGNEKCGTIAINRVMAMLDGGEIKLKKGTITFIPICNPKAYGKNTREIDVNLNRVIDIYDNPSSYEEIIATQVASEICKCDVMTDLHSSHTDDAPFAFLDFNNEENRKIVEASNVSYVVTGFADAYKNSGIVEKSTETFANTKGGVSGVTVECGNHYREETADFATNAVLNVLKKFEMIDGECPESDVVYINMERIIIKESEGEILKKYRNFDKLKAGEIVAKYDNGYEFVMPEDSIMMLPNYDAQIGKEWFYLGKNVTLEK